MRFPGGIKQRYHASWGRTVTLFFMILIGSSSVLHISEAHPPPPQYNDIFGTVFGCASALLETDDNRDGMVKMDEYLDFVNLIADFLCVPERDELDLELRTVFVSIACLCNEREGFSPSCCLGSEAGIHTAGAEFPLERTADQDTYLRAACLLTQAVLGPAQCTLAPETLPPNDIIINRNKEDDDGLDLRDLLLLLAALLLLLLLCCLLCCCFLRRRRQDEESDEEVDEATTAIITKIEENDDDDDDDLEKNSSSPPGYTGVPQSAGDDDDSDDGDDGGGGDGPDGDGDGLDGDDDGPDGDDDGPDGDGDGPDGDGDGGRPRDGDGGDDDDDSEARRRRVGAGLAADVADEAQRRFRGEGGLPDDGDPDGWKLRHVEGEKKPAGDYAYPERDIMEPEKLKREDSTQKFDPYIPDGGVHDPQRPGRDPVEMPRPQYQRPEPVTPEPYDPRKRRLQMGLGDGDVWNALANYEVNDVRSTNLEKIDWVVESALFELNKAERTGDLTRPPTSLSLGAPSPTSERTPDDDQVDV